MLTPSTVHLAPRLSPAATVDGSAVATNANAIAATTPTRRALKVCVPLAIIFHPCLVGFEGLRYLPFSEGNAEHVCHLSDTWSHINP